MAFAERAQQPPPRKTHGADCSVHVVLEQLDDKEREAFQALLDDRRWTATDIRAIAADEGYAVALQTVTRHRNRKCRCFP